MDLVQVLSGEGIGIAKDKKTPVTYELEIFQHRITVGSDTTVPTQKEIHGWIRPVFGEDKEQLTLEMNDESTISFSFIDSDGQIAVNGEIATIA